MDAALLLGVALAAGAVCVARGPLPVVACVLTLAAALVAWRGRPGLALGLVLATALGAARAHVAIVDARAAAAQVPTAPPGKPRLLPCEGEGVVAVSPTRRAAATRLVLDEVRLACDAADPAGSSLRPLVGRVVLYADAEEEGEGAALGRGDRVSFVASLGPPQRFVVPDLGDDEPGSARGLVVLSGGAADVLRVSRGRGLGAHIDAARAHVRARIDATFPAGANGLARALVLGESDLDGDDARDFRESGLSHLLAVSGMHLVVAVNGLVGVLAALLARVRWLALRAPPVRVASFVGVVFCWIYCDFSGSSGSAVRAACMLSVALGAVALGRRVRPLRALGVSIVLVALVDPLAAYDVSFVLSAGATLGLVALGRPLGAALAERGPKVVRAVMASLATTIAASVPCAPILLRMGPAISLGGLVANLVAVPVGEVAALPLCLGHALLSPLPAAERGAALAGGGALVVVRALAHATASSRLGRIALPRPTDAELGAVAAAWLLVGLWPRANDAVVAPRLRSAALAGAVLVGLVSEVVARRAGAPVGVLRVTFVDVGQGDAALVDLPNGDAVMIDAGGLVGSPTNPGERVLAPLLRARRRDRLAAVVISHPHPDHFLGLAEATAGLRVDEAWDTGEVESSEPSASPFGPHVYAATLSALRARGTVVRRPPSLCGKHDVGGAIFEVLAPCPGPSSARGTNDNSFVLRITYGARSVLFVGDAEHTTEEDLVKREATRASLRADVLKVGHHGSRSSSTPAFVDAVAPSHVVVSCGVRNRYGHPHVQTLATFAARPLAVHRTDLEGTVVFETDGESFSVRGSR
jgi:competence protein ComEC